MRKNTSAFTLFELIVVILIIGIMTLFVSMPYRYYGQKIYLKQAAKEVKQSLSEARNMALNGYVQDGNNQNILLQFQEGGGSIEYIVYTGAVSLTPSASIMQTKTLPRGIVLSEISHSDGSSVSDFQISFEAINGDVVSSL